MTDTVDSRSKRKIGWHQVLRFVLALLGLYCCCRLIVSSAVTGLSRLLSTTAIIQSKIGAADIAIGLTPDDPEAHYTRALSLVNLTRLSEAVVELRETTRLRPHHYYEWLDLGVTLDRLGDQTAAIAALKESVRLAPSFAQPRWQLGNLLYRQERYPEAFAELRLGAKSNPGLLQGMMGLAWAASHSDVGTFEALVAPDSGRRHLELASFLVNQGKGADAARQVIEAGEPQDERDRATLHQTISALIATHQFSDAYSAWAASHRLTIENNSKTSIQFLNGRFVEPIIQNDPGFGWQLPVVPNVSASIDPSGPSPGSRSICFEFGGASSPGTLLMHQLVLLQPNSRYSLSFVAKSMDLESGGPPVILALDAGSKTTRILGQSDPLSTGTSGWITYRVDFATDESTSAVFIALQRLACTQSPCPVFGKLWLSEFSLSKV